MININKRFHFHKKIQHSFEMDLGQGLDKRSLAYAVSGRGVSLHKNTEVTN